jgi:lysophospholipase L1-like esterase
VSTRASEVRFTAGRSVFLSTLIVGAVFLLAEGVLRVVGVGRPTRPRLLLRAMDVDIEFPFMQPDADLFWAPRPGWRGEFLGQPVSINALGLRGPELAPTAGRTRRLATFGDSITFGYGVGDEQTYTALAGRLLAGRGVEALNAAVTGYTSHQVLGRLRRLAGQTPIDVATFCIGWNDGTRRVVDDREFARRVHLSMAVEGWADKLYLYRLMKKAYVGAALGPATAENRKPRVSLEQYRENMEAIVRECRSRGIRPVFVALPARRRAGEPPVQSAYMDALEELAARLDVPLLAAGPLGLDGAPESNAEHFIDSLHFSASGHQVMAEQIARQLVERGVF